MKDYHRYNKFGILRLNKSDIDNFIALINDGNSADQNPVTLEIRTQINSIAIVEDSLEKLIQHPEITTQIDNLKITLFNHSKKLYIDVSFGKYDNELRVWGQDQTLVLGTELKLSQFLKSTRKGIGYFSKFFIVIISNIILGAIFSSAGMTLLSLIKNGFNNISLLYLCSAIALLIIYFTLLKIKNVSIVINEKKKNFLLKYGVEISIILSFLTLIVTLIVGVLQIKH